MLKMIKDNAVLKVDVAVLKFSSEAVNPFHGPSRPLLTLFVSGIACNIDQTMLSRLAKKPPATAKAASTAASAATAKANTTSGSSRSSSGGGGGGDAQHETGGSIRICTCVCPTTYCVNEE